MACSSYAHSIHLRARELQPYVDLYRAITEHIYKAQQHRLMPSRVRRGHRNQFWALGAMANCECAEDWGRCLEHFRHLWPSINGEGHSEVGGAY